MRRKYELFQSCGRLGPEFWAYIEAAEALEKLTGRKVIAGELQK